MGRRGSRQREREEEWVVWDLPEPPTTLETLYAMAPLIVGALVMSVVSYVGHQLVGFP